MRGDLCVMMCVMVSTVLKAVRHVPREDLQNTEDAEDPTKTALKLASQGRKLVAGAGFEPATFRL